MYRPMLNYYCLSAVAADAAASCFCLAKPNYHQHVAMDLLEIHTVASEHTNDGRADEEK